MPGVCPGRFTPPGLDAYPSRFRGVPRPLHQGWNRTSEIVASKKA
jgi:hypothetical protein